MVATYVSIAITDIADKKKNVETEDVSLVLLMSIFDL